MPPVIVDLRATTELEAVNAMLTACGEQPLPPATDLTTTTQADVVMALGILRDICREVQSRGWKFNTEFGFEIAPLDSMSWTGSDSVVETLNVFAPPANLIDFEVTPISEQVGSKEVDTVIRPSRVYLDEDDAPVQIFYDRRRGRDGFPAADHPFLYINPTWLFNFEQLPEVARRYIVAVAARELIQSGIGSNTLSDFARDNEAKALRLLVEQHGLEDNYTMSTNLDVRRARGGRPDGPSGVLETRKNRNS